MLDIPDTDSIIEPLSWSALACSGFLWWASAGERRLESEEESEADAALLSGLSLSPPVAQSPLDISSTSFETEGQASQEMGIIAYFHRLTTLILTALSDIVDATDSDDDEEDNQLGQRAQERIIRCLRPRPMWCRCGLDVWSVKDHQFIEDAAREYFGKK